jgi:holo-[acyl-carrier protein] synthase
MSKLIGIDIVEFEEIKERLSDRFINRILSARELERYYNMKSTDARIAYLAGRFAAKEAYTKIYKNFDHSLNFTDVEILNDEYGAPYIISKYRPDDSVSVSISHSRNYAVAVCIMA